ncbi:MAG: transposase [Patescibacteria group bacterium]|nr:transposase [Patescibacteria group bacterium]
MQRKDCLVKGEIYHIFNRSIAEYVIFNDENEYERMQQLVRYYKTENYLRFSDFLELQLVVQKGFTNAVNIVSKDNDPLVQIIAWCIMPTHIHLVLKQLTDQGISNYLRKILESYSSYFNSKHKRKGPLWESKFKNVLVKNDEQLHHLIRYLHLNPVTTYLVECPEKWLYSSYCEYLGKVADSQKMCQFDDILEIKPTSYRKFVNDQISYQRELAQIKKLLFD